MGLMKAKVDDGGDRSLLKDIPEEIFNKRVTYAFTTRGNDIYHKLVIYLLHQKHLFENMNCVIVQNSWRPWIEMLFEVALETPFEFLHLLDSDVAPRRDSTARLVSHDVDIVSQPAWFYDESADSLHLNIHYTEELCKTFTPRDPKEGLEKVAATSFGSVVIQRRVIESFKQAEEKFCEWSPIVDERFKEASPDTIFFLKAAALGFDTYIDWGAEFATHHRMVALNSKTIETFVAHRVLDWSIGEDKKKELLQSKEGREELAAELQRGRKPVPT